MADLAPDSTRAPSKPEPEDYIKIIPLHKIVFFYPTALISLVCAIIMSTQGSFNLDSPPQVVTTAGWLFLAVFLVNFMIITFDFNGIKFLAVMFAVVAFLLGIALISVYYPHFLPGVGDLISTMKPVAMAHFYALVFIMLAGSIAMAVGMALTTDVWYLHSNELVHKRGLLGDAEKYPTMNLRVLKEITDVFEFALLGTGTLIMTPSNVDRPIVLENVWAITRTEKRFRELLSKFKVSA